MLEKIQGDPWGLIPPLRLSGLFPHDLCHGRDSPCWLAAPLEKGRATHASILYHPWGWTVSSMGLQRVRHNKVTFTFTRTATLRFRGPFEKKKKKQKKQKIENNQENQRNMAIIKNAGGTICVTCYWLENRVIIFGFVFISHWEIWEQKF